MVESDYGAAFQCNAMLRNPLTAYDKDAFAIFKQLHQNSQLHLDLACGTLFGCDFLLYDGKRAFDETHKLNVLSRGQHAL